MSAGENTKNEDPEVQAQKAEAKEGIVGFFDILGYQSFLENNEAGDAVNVVINTLADSPEKEGEFRSKYVSYVGDRMEKEIEKAHFQKLVKRTDHLVFSDTILLTLEQDSAADSAMVKHEWGFFTYQVKKITSELWSFGLPIRGCVTTGKYFVKRSCFAGKSIVDAYKTASSIDAAAVVFDKSAMKALIQALGKFPAEIATLSNTLFEYPVPLKDGSLLKDCRVLDILSGWGSAGGEFKRDAKAIVTDCFWKHGKKITPKEYSKLTNTELLFQHMKWKNNI